MQPPQSVPDPDPELQSKKALPFLLELSHFSHVIFTGVCYPIALQRGRACAAVVLVVPLNDAMFASVVNGRNAIQLNSPPVWCRSKPLPTASRVSAEAWRAQIRRSPPRRAANCPTSHNAEVLCDQRVSTCVQCA